MNIEEGIFKRSRFDRAKLLEYGFKEDMNSLVFSKKIDEEFKALLVVDQYLHIEGKVIDLNTEEEYYNIRVKSFEGIFVNSIREKYETLLEDIKTKCTLITPFIGDQANRVCAQVEAKFGVTPEFLWDKLPYAGVFRNSLSSKWFGIIMQIDRSKIDGKRGQIEILNVKLNPDYIDNLLKRKGFFKAYHMNKKYWISVILDGTLEDDFIMDLVDLSYSSSFKK